MRQTATSQRFQGTSRLPNAGNRLAEFPQVALPLMVLVMVLLNDKEWSGYSDHEIARRCGVGPDMVAKYRNGAGESTSTNCTG